MVLLIETGFPKITFDHKPIGYNNGVMNRFSDIRKTDFRKSLSGYFGKSFYRIVVQIAVVIVVWSHREPA